MGLMAVNPIVPNTWEVRCHFSRTDGEEMVNTFYVDDGGGSLGPSDATDIVAVVEGAWTDDLIPYMSNSVSLDKITVTDLTTLSGPQFITASALVGALSDNPIPNQVAGVVTWRTDTRGRSFRGRTYLGGFTEAHSVGGAPDGTLRSAMADWASDLNGGFAGLPHTQTVVSRYHQAVAGVPPTIPRVTNLSTAITAWSVDLAWKTQRRRALKG